MIRPVAATPTSAWISRASRSSRNDWSTLRPNQLLTLNNCRVFDSPFLNRSRRLLIAIAVLGMGRFHRRGRGGRGEEEDGEIEYGSSREPLTIRRRARG